MIRPIDCVDDSVNQIAPSGPVTRFVGVAETSMGPEGKPTSIGVLGIGYSVMSPAGVTFPILLAPVSTNQRLPSGPTVIALAEALLVGIV